jgi:hypothetical protein
VHSRYFEGSFPTGGELRSPPWYGTCRGARPLTQGSRLHLTQEPSSLVVATFACTCLQPGPVGVRKGLRRKACFSFVDQGTRSPPEVRLVVFTGVGASGEDILQVPLGRLIPEVLLSRGHLAVVHLFLARPAARRGAVFGRLLASFADAFCEVNDLATLRGAVATMRVHRA